MMRRVSDLNYPTLTRRLERFACKHYMSLARDKKYDPLVSELTSLQVITINLSNKTHIAPEYKSDTKWHKFYINGLPLVSLLPNMSGTIQNRHKVLILKEWYQWLVELIKLNNLSIKIARPAKIIPIKPEKEIKNIDDELIKLSKDTFIENLSPSDKMHLVGRPYLRKLFKNRPLLK